MTTDEVEIEEPIKCDHCKKVIGYSNMVLYYSTIGIVTCNKCKKMFDKMKADKIKEKSQSTPKHLRYGMQGRNS